MFDSVDLAATLVELARLEGADLGDAERIDQIRLLEQIKAAAAAAQARISVAFDASQRLRAAERGLPAAAQGQGIAGQIALARRESPFLGARHLGLAKTLVAEMPHTLAALTRGETTEWRATLMARETAELSREDRIAVDAEVGPGARRAGRPAGRAPGSRGRLQARPARLDPAHRPGGVRALRHSPARSRCDELPHRLRCRSPRASRSTPPCAGTPTRSWAPVPAPGAPATRSWPTPWSPGSPAASRPPAPRSRSTW